ncbi:HNH endonuclease signature motif containing protein [Lysinibacillus sp. NPDC093712]|uniref:HNH endonuclease signature motif containing protein n=1 Tax=Lysinibacillus sp. NPDC093712 TaxID=3390579 RepID=UPI003D0724C9
MAKKKEIDRIEVPKNVSNEAMFLSDSTCCKCREPRKAVQTHHIDDDPSNSYDLDNLAVLCLQCHDETMIKGGFGRKLNAELVIRYRDDWYETVKSRRQNTPSIPSVYNDLEDMEFNEEKLFNYYKELEISCHYDLFKEAIVKFLDLTEREQLVLTKLLKNHEKNNAINVSKIIRINPDYINEIQNLIDDKFIIFSCDWRNLSTDSEGYIIDPSEDINLAVKYKDGWSFAFDSHIILSIYRDFNKDKLQEFIQTLYDKIR